VRILNPGRFGVAVALTIAAALHVPRIDSTLPRSAPTYAAIDG